MRIATLCLLLVSVSLVACGGDKPPVETAANPPAEPVAPEPMQEAVAAAEPDDVHIEGDHITIDRHINFASDSDEILEDSFELLDHIAQLIGLHTDKVKHLKIIGHTDESGDDGHNMKLSERRAAAVENALKERGVAIELEHSGAGETQPVCEEDTDECHSRNRRVEFLIVPESA